MESEYELPGPPRSERSGRGSIQRSITTGSRGSSPPRGTGRQGGDSSGGSSSSSSSSDSESDRPNRLGDEISRLIRALRKKDSRNRVAKCPEAVFLGKAPKMREPETYEGCRESYVPWMKAVKEYMTVRSMDFRDNTTKIYWLGSLLKGEARNWHQNRLATAEKELQPDTWAAYKAAMDYHFRDPHEKRTFTNKMADLYCKGTPGHTKTGLSADQWGIRMAMYPEKAQCDGEVLKEIYWRRHSSCLQAAATVALRFNMANEMAVFNGKPNHGKSLDKRESVISYDLGGEIDIFGALLSYYLRFLVEYISRYLLYDGLRMDN
jgi:hypothetical protein